MTHNKFDLAEIMRHWLMYPIWMLGLAITMLIGLAAGIAVLVKGLSLTGLTDSIPWGLWITLDLSSIAISAGAFSLSAAVYILGIKNLRPVARVAVFVGLIGYSMALLALLLDIGRPDRFWHAMVYWNTHSVLWEVTMCVALYFSVLIVEFAPLIGEAAWMQKLSPRLAAMMAKLHHAAPLLAVAGLGLSLLHQSSLGAMYGIIKARPIWFKPDMSILFIISAVAAGQAITVFACMVVGKLRGRMLVDRSLIDGVARFIGFTLLGYLYLRFWDFLSMNYTNVPGRGESLSVMTSGILQWNFWIGEIILGAAIPAGLLLWARTRNEDRFVMLATALIVMGVVIYRSDTNLSGLIMTVAYTDALTPTLVTYTPTWIEWATTFGVVAYGLMAFTLGVRYLPVFSSGQHENEVKDVKELTPSAMTA
jgi:molybdopterin-containing oxidoreductase family membrane subunit